MITDSPDIQIASPGRWVTAQADLFLRRGEVHVFFASLASSIAVECNLEALLSHDERFRAGQFVFERDRRRYVVARSLLRRILGCYLRVHPASLVFSYGATGKPALAGHRFETLDFNLSHSSDRVLIAVAIGRAVGVDLECIRPLPDINDMAERVFSDAEIALFASVSPEKRLRLFFELWTRKEAFIKATGDGFSFPVDRLDASLRSHQHGRFLRPCDVGGGESRWTLRTLLPDPGYAAALVVEGEGCDVRCWRWAMR